MSSLYRESPDTIANRLYLAGVTEDCSEQDIYQMFSSHYGSSSIERVQIISFTKMKKSKQKRANDPIAFVTCQNPAVVQQIIQDYNNKEIHTKHWKNTFQNMEMAALPAKKQSQNNDMFHQIETLSKQTNVILQVNTSHVHRMIDFIDREIICQNMNHNNNNTDSERAPCIENIQIIGTSKAIPPYQCVSFIYIHAASMQDEDDLFHYLWSPNRHIISRCALIKMYRVNGVCTLPFQMSIQDKTNHIVTSALEQWTMSHSHVLQRKDHEYHLNIRIESCPSRLLQKSMVQALSHTLQDEIATFHNTCSIQMSLDDNTHTLAAVKLYSPPKSTKLYEREYDLYLIGISRSLPNHETRASTDKEIISKLTKDNDADILCRAYYKLEEAFHRYDRKYSICMDNKYPIAFDCGSSPGGWTKYLIESVKCMKVYSCDPGALDSSVQLLQGVEYLNMKGRDGMNIVRNNGDLINIWVSDMCLVDPSEQLNHLFAAHEKGILASDAMFVLTIKCNTGHSKGSYDKTCQEEVLRLEQTLDVTDVYICHLFSNRKGERTIMGRLNNSKK